MPNLEQIIILSNTRLEMPPPPFPNHPLKTFILLYSEFDDNLVDTYDKHVGKTRDNFQYRYYPMNVDNLLLYPNIEVISLYNNANFFYQGDFKQFKKEFPNVYNLNNRIFYKYVLKNTANFVKKVTTAYKEGKLPHLRKVVLNNFHNSFVEKYYFDFTLTFQNDMLEED